MLYVSMLFYTVALLAFWLVMLCHVEKEYQTYEEEEERQLKIIKTKSKI